MDELERLNQDKYFGGLYNAEEEHRKMEKTARLFGIDEGKAIGKTIGIEEGKTIGAKENSMEIAKKLLEEKVDINIISKVTDLSIEEIKKLQ